MNASKFHGKDPLKKIPKSVNTSWTSYNSSPDTLHAR